MRKLSLQSKPIIQKKKKKKKKSFLQVFLSFSGQIEIENYKLTYESQFAHFIKWGKICVKFRTFYDQFDFQLQKGSNVFI